MRILVAIDGSQHSDLALEALESIAPATQVIVLHVMQLPRLAYPAVWTSLEKDFSLRVETTMKEEGEKLLDLAVSRLSPYHPHISKRLEISTPAEAVLTVAESTRVDLIVVGARGLGLITKHVLGSVSHRISTHAKCPILVVQSPMPHPQNILLPVASQEDANAAVEFLGRKPFRECPQVTVLHVIPFSEPVSPVGALIPESFREEMMTSAERMTNEIAARLGEHGYTAKGMAVMGTPGGAIAQEASKGQHSLILMGAKSRPGVSRFLLGSVSHSVLHQTQTSVLLVR